MKIPGLRKSDIVAGSQAPPWFEESIRPLEEQVKTLTTAASAKLSPADNFNAEEKVVDLSHGGEALIRLSRVAGKPRHIVATCATHFVLVKMQVVEESLIRVTAHFPGTPPSGSVPVQLWIQGP